MGTRTFDVLLHGARAGYLVEDEASISFRFADSYRQNPRRPVLSQSFEDDLERVYVGKGRHLPTFFGNLVPEGALRSLLQELTGVSVADDLALLAAVGRDLPGAVTIQPSDTDAGLLDLPGTEDGGVGSDGATTEKAEGLRFSLAGAQLKFSVIREHDKLTVPAKGHHGNWIVKVDSSHYIDLVKNEYSTLEWARGVGFEVPECYLQSVDDLYEIPREYAFEGSLLVIRRYDRDETERIHQEDMAQALGRRAKHKYDYVTYEQLAFFVKTVCGEAAYEEFVRRLCFIIASGNADAHLKNWSIIYPDRIRAALAPLYDQVCTVAWSKNNPELRKLALKLGGARDFAQIDEKVFRRFAQRAQSDADRTVELVRETVERCASTWRTMHRNLPMPEAHIVSLREHWHRTPLLRTHASAL